MTVYNLYLFSSSVTNETYKINHQFDCNEKCLVYLLLAKNIWNNMLDKLLIPFDIVGITTKVTTENLNALRHVCMNICFGISQVQVIDKMDPSDPLKRENFWWETVMTTEPYGLGIDDSVWFFSFDDMVSRSKNSPEKKSPVRGQG